MLQTSEQAEQAALLAVAQQMCAAIRTAPKTQAKDYLASCVVTGEELFRLAEQMDALNREFDKPFLSRDAENVRRSGAVVLIGVKNAVHGIDRLCGYCGHGSCRGCTESGGICAFAPIDLGIAVGSAVALASDNRIDSRVMFSVGRASMALGYLPEGFGMILGIPLSVSGKSPYFDRK